MNRYCVTGLPLTLVLVLSGFANVAHAAAADPSSDTREDQPAGSMLEAEVDTPPAQVPAQVDEVLTDVRPDEPTDNSGDQLTDEPTNGHIDASIDGSIARPEEGVAGRPMEPPPVVGELAALRVELARVQLKPGGQRMVTVSEEFPASLASLATAAEELVFTVYFINPQTEPAAGLALVHEVPQGFEYVAFSGTGPGADFTVSTDGGLSFHQEADAEAGRASHLCWRFDAVLYPNTRGLVTFRARAQPRAADDAEPAVPEPPAQAQRQKETSAPDKPAASGPASNSDAVRTGDQPADDSDAEALNDAAAGGTPDQ